MGDEEKPAADSFVRSAKNVITGIIMASLLGIGGLVINSNIQIAVLSEKVGTLALSVQTLTANGYTAAAAASDLRSRDTQISHNTGVLEDHEKRLRELEINSAMSRK